MTQENIPLRDGSGVADIRLDRLQEFDERSRGYRLAVAKTEREPRSYSWRVQKVLDQGREGACVGFGITAHLIGRPAENLLLDNEYARQLYFDAQRGDQWPGGAYPGAFPKYEGTSVLAGVKVAQARGWFARYEWAFGLDDLALGVGYHGPAVLGLPWCESMYAPNGEGYLTVSGSQVGGHCILCRAVDVARRRFILRNSWGDGWGLGGDCYVAFSDMAKLLANGGEAVFFVGNHKVPRVAL